ncbi:MAG: RHS repeat-associated core domain-containing protein [Oscillospiraceae bacterium]|nr:MAG: RHS repeat-associated core domain-containing protein [Oscillospiraceae bacterium]
MYAQYNPFRYRGYYYDSELGMYYLQSRYYDPAVGRFINADESDYLGTDNSLIGYNLFAYCDNNPVMNIDPSGTFSWKKLSAIVAVTAIIVVSVVATVATFGAASVAGTIAITSAITIAAKSYRGSSFYKAKKAHKMEMMLQM